MLFTFSFSKPKKIVIHSVTFRAASMPKVKHGRRHNLYKVKNGERKWQARKILEDISNSSADSEATTVLDFFTSLMQPSTHLLPEMWNVFREQEYVEFSWLQHSPPRPSIVKWNLILYRNFHWGGEAVWEIGSKSALPRSVSCDNFLL